MSDDRIHPDPGSPEQHWRGSDPENQPSRDRVVGLPRLVLECYTRLGTSATPKDVADELRRCGVDVSEEDVLEVWSEGRKSPP